MTGVPLVGPEPGAAISAEVAVAGCCFVGSGALVAVALWMLPAPAVVALLGWPVLALAGALVLDQRPGSPTGRVLVALGLMPAVVLVWAAARVPSGADPATVIGELAALSAVGVAVSLPWAACPPRTRRGAGAAAVVAVAGALLGPVAAVGGLPPAAEPVGLVVAMSGVVVSWVLVARVAAGAERLRRRRALLELCVLGGLGSAVLAGWLTASVAVAAWVTAGALALLAVTVARLILVADLRPLVDHAVDLGLTGAAVATAVAVGFTAYLLAGWVHSPVPGASAAITGVLTGVMALAAASWARRALVVRRYGTGTLSTADVQLITADLHALTEPRALLGKAARMVATASGSRTARLVLGSDPPEVPPPGVAHPLLVGGDRVGTLAVEASGAEGLELRQRRIIAQLLPTVALVAAAVGIAVEAEHARRDVQDELEAQRRRILGDLHDGLGPVLAGMSMRVRAALRTAAPGQDADLLEQLAADLSTGRTDLRRMVSGLTPSHLDDGDLASALDRLVQSFRGTGQGPPVSLDVQLASTPMPELSVAVYRCVAEGLTNALRHAGARSVVVRLHSTDRCVTVSVEDDGTGGPVVPGVGLSSLAARARELGGSLTVHAQPSRGTQLRLQLPLRATTPS